MKPNFAIKIATLPDERLEAFVNDWIQCRTKDYHSHERWSGPGDLGRDVVGYLTGRRHEGPWDNFQCKQLSQKLSELSAFVELGKIFMHSANGEYTLPREYVFVAPRGVVRNVQSYIAHPSKFQQAFLDRWDEKIAPNLVQKKKIKLDDRIRRVINKFDFENVSSLDAVRLADDAYVGPVLVKWFDDDPGPAPKGIAPDEVQEHESSYIGQLVDLYSERSGESFVGPDSVLAHPEWGNHLRDQRTRYFEAAEFDRYYRDSTLPEYLDTYKEDMYQGVVDVHGKACVDGLERVGNVMAQAAVVSPSGVLGKHARVSVKQGSCHHFANEGRLPWKS